MLRLVLAFLMCLAASGASAAPLLAGPAPLLRPVPAPPPPGLMCRQAIAAASRAHGLPPGLMAAIGQVESGRRDPLTGAWRPWPWTVDAEGQGTFYDTKPQAVAAVQALEARGVRSIDVGCMQVNLLHHPDAFPDLEKAFDPAANADYAARFLVALHGQTGTWPEATALYHSATPDLAAAYKQKVMAAWPEAEQVAAVAPGPAAARGLSGLAGTVLFPPPARGSGVRILPQRAGPGGVVPPGRSLNSYRALPIMQGRRRAAG